MELDPNSGHGLRAGSGCMGALLRVPRPAGSSFTYAEHPDNLIPKLHGLLARKESHSKQRGGSARQSEVKKEAEGRVTRTAARAPALLRAQKRFLGSEPWTWGFAKFAPPSACPKLRSDSWTWGFAKNPTTPQSACRRKKAGMSMSSRPPLAMASTIAAACVRSRVRQTLGVLMLW